MKYIIFKSGKFEMYDNITKSDGVYDYFAPRLKRDRTIPIWQGGYLKVEDRKFEKFVENIKKLRDKKVRLDMVVGNGISWKSEKFGDLLIEKAGVTNDVIDNGVWTNNYDYRAQPQTIEGVANAEIKDIEMHGINVGFNVFGRTYTNTSMIQSEYSKRIKDKPECKSLKMLKVYKPYSELFVGDFIISKGKFIDKFDNLFCLEDHNITGYYSNYTSARLYENTEAIYSNMFYEDSTFVIPLKIIKEIISVSGGTRLVGLTNKYKEFNHMRMVDNKTIEYIPESRLSRFNGNFNDPDLRAKFCQKTSVMKMIKACFMLKDSQIETISANLDIDDNDFSDIQIISGEKITWAYSHGADTGTIGSSCMRHESCSGRFKLYEKNAKMVSIIKGNVVMARALLWEIINKKSGEKINMMDRIYVSNDRLIGKLKNYAKQNGWAYLERQCAGNEFAIFGDKSIRLTDYYIQLDGEDYSPYPYVDTWYIKCGNRAYVKSPIVSMR